MSSRTISTSLRGVFIGSGSDGMQLELFCKEIFSLASKATPQVLYVGTATYCKSGPEIAQTKELKKMGASISRLLLEETVETATAKFQAADIIVVSGGNTLFAVDRWKHIGIDQLFLQAGQRGCVCLLFFVLVLYLFLARSIYLFCAQAGITHSTTLPLCCLCCLCCLRS